MLVSGADSEKLNSDDDFLPPYSDRPTQLIKTYNMCLMLSSVVVCRCFCIPVGKFILHRHI